MVLALFHNLSPPQFDDWCISGRMSAAQLQPLWFYFPLWQTDRPDLGQSTPTPAWGPQVEGGWGSAMFHQITREESRRHRKLETIAADFRTKGRIWSRVIYRLRQRGSDVALGWGEFSRPQCQMVLCLTITFDDIWQPHNGIQMIIIFLHWWVLYNYNYNYNYKNNYKSEQDGLCERLIAAYLPVCCFFPPLGFKEYSSTWEYKRSWSWSWKRLWVLLPIDSLRQSTQAKCPQKKFKFDLVITRHSFAFLLTLVESLPLQSTMLLGNCRFHLKRCFIQHTYVHPTLAKWEQTGKLLEGLLCK